MNKIFKFCKKYLKQKRGLLVLYVLICIVSSLATIISPYISGNFIDQLANSGSMEFFEKYLLIFIAINVTSLCLGYLGNRLSVFLQSKLAFNLNIDAIKHLQNVSLNTIHKKDTVYLNQRINNDSNSIISFCISLLQNIVINIIMQVVSLVILFRFSFYIGITLTILNFLYFISYRLFKSSLYKVNYAFREEQAKFFSKYQEQLANTRFIQLHGLEGIFINRLLNAFPNLLSKALLVQKTSYIFSSVDRIFMILANILIFIFGGHAVINNIITIGTFTIITSYFIILTGSTRYFFSLGQSIQDNMVCYNRLDELFSINIKTNGNNIIPRINSISLRNINFSYGDRHILTNISAVFETGKIYAIVGMNGSGKSTFINLLTGLFVDEYEGEILYNDQLIQNLDMIRLRKDNMAISEQEPLLIHDTYKSNLIVDRDFVFSESSLNLLCETLEMNEFFNSLPSGMDTVVNERSSNLSGGEKQKISLIRTLLKDTELIILDEPTSALDKESGKRLMQLLEKKKKGKIIIISTHDKDVIDKCDRLIEL